LSICHKEREGGSQRRDQLLPSGSVRQRGGRRLSINESGGDRQSASRPRPRRRPRRRRRPGQTVSESFCAPRSGIMMAGERHARQKNHHLLSRSAPSQPPPPRPPRPPPASSHDEWSSAAATPIAIIYLSAEATENSARRDANEAESARLPFVAGRMRREKPPLGRLCQGSFRSLATMQTHSSGANPSL